MNTTPSPRTIEVKSETLFDAVWGACPNVWSWYHGFSVDEGARTLTVVMETGEWNDEKNIPVGKRATLTVTDLRRAIDALAAKYPNAIGGDIADECRSSDPDLDSSMADAVIQYAVLGDIVFG
jgi:hypothetical protein